MAGTPPSSIGTGGGAATIADGADVAEGAVADAAVAAGAAGTLSAKLRRLTTDLDALQLVDNAAFTDGASHVVPAGYIFDDVAGTALTENDVAAARVDSKRATVSVIEDATTRGQRAAVNANGEQIVAVRSNGASWSLGVQGDGGGPGVPANTQGFGFTFGGSTWDRERGNEQATLLASAARTAATSSADQTNYNGRGVCIVTNVTAEGGATTLTLTVQGKESISSNYYDLITGIVVYNAATDTPPTTRAVILYPGTLAANYIGIAGATGATGLAVSVPRIWRITITPSDATSQTYSVSGVTLV